MGSGRPCCGGGCPTQDREGRLVRSKELNIRVCNLPSFSSDPLQSALSFIHNTLDLTDIDLEKAWNMENYTLIIQFQSLCDCLRTLRDKRLLASLPYKVFLDADLMRLQVEELRKAREQVVTPKKESKWAVVKGLKAMIQDSPLPIGLDLGQPSDALVRRKGNIIHLHHLLELQWFHLAIFKYFPRCAHFSRHKRALRENSLLSKVIIVFSSLDMRLKVSCS